LPELLFSTANLLGAQLFHHTTQGTHIAITAALVTACALGLMFSSTRWMGIAAAALLTAIHPIPSVAILILGLAIFYVYKS
jgi:ABC-type proline/glycine betaine transport system permease subunit